MNRVFYNLKFVALLLFVFLPFFSFALEGSKLSLENVGLSDSKKEWNVAICEFNDKGVKPSNSHVLKTIPNLIYEKISLCDKHKLSFEEQQYLLKEIFSAQILENQKKLSSLQKEIDTLFFSRENSSSAKSAKQKELRDLFIKIDEINKAKENIHLYEIVEEKTVKLLSNSSEAAIFPPLLATPAEFIKEKNLDMLICGTVSQIEGLLYFTVELYSAYSNSPISQSSSGGAFNEVSTLVEKEVKPVIEGVLGRKWSTVTIEILPLTATIRFSDGETGVGAITRTYIQPGKYKLRLDALGYISEEIDLILEPNEINSHTIRMQKDLTHPIVFQSFPNGADLYLSSTWIGKTPLLVENAGVGEPFLLRKEGSSDFYGNMSDYEKFANSLTNINLNSSLYLNEELLKTKRNDMYNSLTMMAISVPFFLFGFSYDKKWEEFSNTLSSSPFVSSGKAVTLDKKFFDVTTTRSGLGLMNQMGLTMFVSSVVNLILDMVEYVQVFDKM